MLATAMKLIDPENHLFTMMDMKRHYFEGVNTRLGAYFKADKKPYIQRAMASQKKALALEDRAGYVYHELGELAFLNGVLDTSIAYFEKALELVPGWAQPMISLSKVYHEMDRYDLSESWSKKAIDAQHDNPFGYFWLAQSAFDNGDYLIAEENFLKCIRLNDKHYLPFEQLGYLNMELTNYEESENYFKEAELRKRFVKDIFGIDEFSRMYSVGDGLWHTLYLELDTTLFGPNDDMAYFAYGYNSFKNLNYTLAEKAFKKVIQINYKDPLVYRYLGELMVKEERWMEAELYFDFAKAMYLQKESFDSYAKRLYKKQFCKDANIESIYTSAYYKAIENDFFLGYIYEKWGYYTKAEENYFKIMVHEKDYFDAAFVKCYQLYARQELYQLAESLIKKYVHRDKKKWRAQLFGLYDQWKIKQADNWLPNYKAGEMMYNLAFLEKDTILLDLEERIDIPGTNEEIQLQYYTYNKISLYEIKNYYERSLEDMTDMDTFILANVYQRLGDVYDQLSIHSNNLNDEEVSEGYYQKAADILPNPSNKEKLIQRSNKNYNYSNAFKELKYLRDKDQLSFEGIVQLGEYHVKKGSLDEDEGILDYAASVYPIPFTKTIENKALNFFLDEDYEEAIELYKQLLEVDETRKDHLHYTLARLYMDDILLDTATAMIYLEKAIDLGFDYTWVIDFDPIFSDQHEHPEWKRLRARLPESNINEKLKEADADVYLRPIFR
jgi:tetratricopeptide (TPR) repeat protein